MKTYIQNEITRTAQVLTRMAGDETLALALATVSGVCVDALRNGRKILFAGNGGSAADAQHLAAELAGRLLFERPALAALALTADTAILTAIGNDYGYERVFARQIEAVGGAGDIFIALSTSGRSRNLVCALERARERGLVTVGVLGAVPGHMGPLCDHRLHIPDGETQKIQEGHIVVGHILCALIERALFAPELFVKA
ncbi:MAG: phosphoheptose isomerase [Rhodospirillaceae bacterium]|nr:MAG: phosphoheptose isomerase [Rhodospirillaceae bacterium]